MNLGIMQPYFLPYLGYFQLINSVDTFVVYDNIQYTKKGWINRNRLLINGEGLTFSLPIKKDSDYLHIMQRSLASSFDKKKFINRFLSSYIKAPYFSKVYPLLEQIVFFDDNNLFHYINHSIACVCDYLEIKTIILNSSNVNIDHSLKSQDKVLALCEHLGATTYINPIGGTELYDSMVFKEKGINLKFLKPSPLSYRQASLPFVPWLSIIDVLMFNSPEFVQELIDSNFTLI